MPLERKGFLRSTSRVVRPARRPYRRRWPILAAAPVEDAFPPPSQLVGNGELFVLKVVGDSMNEAAIRHGGWVTVRSKTRDQLGNA